MTKLCSKCKIEKEFKEFDYDKYTKTGKSSICKECRKIKDIKYRESNKEKIKEYQKKYETENKEKRKEYSIKNIIKIREKRKEYYKNNKEKIYEKNKKYKEYRNAYWKNRRNNDKSYVLNKRIQRGILHLIKDKQGKKWQNLLGYTLNDLIEYFKAIYNFDIEKDLNEEIHIDHIIPKSLYKFSSCNDEEFKKCWNLRNLRPISKNENLLKHDNLDLELIKKYNIEDLLPK